MTLFEIIENKKTLTGRQRAELTALLTHGCRTKTVSKLYARLKTPANIPNRPIYMRVSIVPEVGYQAFEDYNLEIRDVRRLLLC